MAKPLTIAEALAKANKHISKKVNAALADEVFKQVQDTEAEAIKEDVYDAYEPQVYVRRGPYNGAGTSGGLGDKSNIVMASQPTGGRLEVINITEPNINRGSYQSDDKKWASVIRNAQDKNLPEQIEYGHNNPYQYDWPRQKRAYMKPRRFTRGTIRRLRDSGSHIRALKAGLEKRGLRVKQGSATRAIKNDDMDWLYI